MYNVYCPMSARKPFLDNFQPFYLTRHSTVPTKNPDHAVTTGRRLQFLLRRISVTVKAPGMITDTANVLKSILESKEMEV